MQNPNPIVETQFIRILDDLTEKTKIEKVVILIGEKKQPLYILEMKNMEKPTFPPLVYQITSFADNKKFEFQRNFYNIPNLNSFIETLKEYYNFGKYLTSSAWNLCPDAKSLYMTYVQVKKMLIFERNSARFYDHSTSPPALNTTDPALIKEFIEFDQYCIRRIDNHISRVHYQFITFDDKLFEWGQSIQRRYPKY
jgi:hypothetical protein